ncbi:MAG: Arginase [uncultured bacterium]|nr:MAG: Arginase [uncultured bacterium]OGT32687.1 MAG: hypothetical protein A3C44_00195 [Gammaproteobacteria bacterium RIFCSPHIGHO2_02_FULL_39_13]OGT48651.1 MAG: hypothetical protein A3E53_05165 [Gammaproteobacteria bacterium RIFCSPHIGHO2_12_FULL_39_24]
MKKKIDINLYVYGNAAQNPDCAQGAVVLKNALEKSDLASHCNFHAPLTVHNPQQKQAAIKDVVILTTQLAHSTQHAMLEKKFFITLGGDNTASIGSWSGTAENNIGLIWFDAHMDAHTFETTPSNNIHGMPLAVLLGYGDKKLTDVVTTKLNPHNVVLVGIRSYESGEAALLKKLGVKIFYMHDIKKQGIKKIMQDAVSIVTRDTTGFGIVIDLDFFDPLDAPGVGTPEQEGVRSNEFLPEFNMIAHHPQLMGADIVEFNPVLDVADKTKKLALELVRILASE